MPEKTNKNRTQIAKTAANTGSRASVGSEERNIPVTGAHTVIGASAGEIADQPAESNIPAPPDIPPVPYNAPGPVPDFTLPEEPLPGSTEDIRVVPKKKPKKPEFSGTGLSAAQPEADTAPAESNIPAPPDIPPVPYNAPGPVPDSTLPEAAQTGNNAAAEEQGTADDNAQPADNKNEKTKSLSDIIATENLQKTYRNLRRLFNEQVEITAQDTRVTIKDPDTGETKSLLIYGYGILYDGNLITGSLKDFIKSKPVFKKIYEKYGTDSQQPEETLRDSIKEEEALNEARREKAEKEVKRLSQKYGYTDKIQYFGFSSKILYYIDKYPLDQLVKAVETWETISRKHGITDSRDRGEIYSALINGLKNGRFDDSVKEAEEIAKDCVSPPPAWYKGAAAKPNRFAIKAINDSVRDFDLTDDDKNTAYITLVVGGKQKDKIRETYKKVAADWAREGKATSKNAVEIGANALDKEISTTAEDIAKRLDKRVGADVENAGKRQLTEAKKQFEEPLRKECQEIIRKLSEPDADIAALSRELPELDKKVKSGKAALETLFGQLFPAAPQQAQQPMQTMGMMPQMGYMQ